MRSNHAILGAVLLPALLAGPAAGQALTRLGPLERPANAAMRMAAPMPPSFRLGVSSPAPYRLGAVRQAEWDAVERHPQLPMMGIERSIEAVAQSRGEWLALDDGKAAWRVAIQSDGATGLRVHFHDFAVADGAVWVYSEDRSQVFGPYTGTGIDESGDFWSHAVFADTVVVEYLADTRQEAVPFSITRIAHLTAGEQTMSASSCELDVSCYSPWSGTASGVGMYMFQTGGASYLCSGALVNNTNKNGKPYFLTANHCVSNAATAQTVEVFWKYQTSTCNGAPPSLANSPTTLGATYLASAPIANGDYSMMLLSQLPANANLTFYGWNASATALNVGGSAVGIHHPGGDYTRIMFGARNADASVQVGSDLAPANMFYQIQATAGVIEPGSSGSPLFTPDQSIVGTLTYGPIGNACSISPFVAGYGRFAVAYPAFSQYLSPAPAAAVTPSPASLSVNWTIGTAAPAAQAIQVSTTSAAAVGLSAMATQSWIVLSANSLSASQSRPASLSVTFNTASFGAGTYSGSITLTGTGISVSIPVTVKVAAAATVAVTPSPAALSMSWTMGAAAPAAQTVQVTTTSSTSVALTAKASQSWIVPSTSSLSVSQSKPGSLSVSVTTSSFTAAGNYSGSVSLTGTGVSVSIPVTVTVNAAATVVTGGQTTLIPLIEDGGGVSTTFTLLNPYPTATAASLSFFSGSGAPLSISTGTAAASWQNLTIPAYGTATVTTAGSSNPQKTGFAIVQTGDSTKRVTGMAQVGLDLISPSAAVAPPFAVPFDATSTSTTTLYIFNPATTGSATLGLAILNSSGTTVGTGQIVIPAQQQGAVPMSKSLAVFSGQKGMLYVTGPATVWAMAMRVDGGGRIEMVPPVLNH